MTALIITASVIAGLVGYLAIGVQARRYTLPRALDRAYRHYEDLYAGLTYLSQDKAAHRRSAIRSVEIDGVSGLTLWLWPVLVPYYALSRRGKSLEAYAPWAAEERAISAEKRIAELERELGIGGRK